VLNKRRPRRARANCSRSSRKFSNVLLPRKVHTVRSFRVVALRAACQPACKAPAAQQVVVRTSVLWAVRRPSRRLSVRPARRPQHSKSVSQSRSSSRRLSVRPGGHLQRSKSVRAAALRTACQPARKAPAAQQVVVRTSVLWAVRRPSRRLPVRPGGRPQHSKSVRAAALRAACQSARKATKSAASRLRISVPQGCSPPVAPLVSPPRRAPAWRHNVPDCRGYRCVSRKHRTRSVSSAM
jgi:hypothetical protein